MRVRERVCVSMRVCVKVCVFVFVLLECAGYYNDLIRRKVTYVTPFSRPLLLEAKRLGEERESYTQCCEPMIVIVNYPKDTQLINTATEIREKFCGWTSIYFPVHYSLWKKTPCSGCSAVGSTVESCDWQTNSISTKLYQRLCILIWCLSSSDPIHTGFKFRWSQLCRSFFWNR